jgi:hypothetical protein
MKKMKVTKLDTKVKVTRTEKWYVLNEKVFELDGCPDWAQYAAVDASGVACWHEAKPELDGILWISKRRIRLITDGDKLLFFDAINWDHSLIERPNPEYVKVKYSSIKFPQKGSMRILVRGTWYKIPRTKLHPAEYQEMLRLRRAKLPAGVAEKHFSSWGMYVAVSTGWQQLQDLPYREVIFG